MWNNTEKMPHAIAKGLAAAGVDYKMHHVVQSDKNDMITDIFKAKGVLVGFPTINNRYLPRQGQTRGRFVCRQGDVSFVRLSC
jgi:anaerobic nitric oxide reductase flavorubredoxin